MPTAGGIMIMLFRRIQLPMASLGQLLRRPDRLKMNTTDFVSEVKKVLQESRAEPQTRQRNASLSLAHLHAAMPLADGGQRHW